MAPPPHTLTLLNGLMGFKNYYMKLEVKSDEEVWKILGEGRRSRFDKEKLLHTCIRVSNNKRKTCMKRTADQ